jgi:polar amino acid transport system permease protein
LSGSEPPAVPRPAAIRAVPVRHPGRWAAAALLVVLAAMFVHMLVTNTNFAWGEVRHWFFWHTVLTGAGLTLEITALAMLIGVAGGVVLAVMRLSRNPLASSASWLYIWFFRGTPVLIQLSFWFYIALLVGKHVSIGVPFGPAVATYETKTLFDAVTAAVLALGLNEAAYMSEIVRAGILSVDEGQSEAATALGMVRLQVTRRIVLPQAMRVIIPPTGNETISMLKTSSLASTIGVAELTGVADSIGVNHAEPMPLLIVASLWYLIFTTILSIGQYYLERRFARGAQRALPPTPFQKLMAANLSLRRRTYSTARAGVAPDPEAAP